MLLLAGTTEAAELAALLAERNDLAVLASLAGRTSEPAAMTCPVRVGGFGGVDGLVAALRDGGHHLLVDATHPFAAQMPGHASEAAAIAGVPRLRLLRPPWRPVGGDRWHCVANLAAAAVELRAMGARRVFVSTGRLELAPFASLLGVQLVIRSIEPPDPAVLPGATVVLDRGPFDIESELALLRQHCVDAVVTKNSGGAATAAKLTAARRLGLPVVVVDRPPAPAGPVVATVAEAVAWIGAHRRR